MSGAVFGRMTIAEDHLMFTPYGTRFAPWLRVGFSRGRSVNLKLADVERAELLSPSRYPALRPMAGLQLLVDGGKPLSFRMDAAEEVLSELSVAGVRVVDPPTTRSG
jgi:hypothetical protein